MLDEARIDTELALIAEGFRVARSTGLWTSAYPQSAWCYALGCDVREQAPPPAIPATPRTRPTVHAVGFALGGPNWGQR